MSNGTDLVLEYYFDEGSGTQIYDTGPSGLTAELEPGADYESPSRTTGYVDGGLHFDGSALLNVGNHSVLNVSSFTLMAWVFYSWDGYPNPTEERQEVLEKVGSYWLNIRKTGRRLRVGFRTCDGNQRRLDSVASVPENTWTHVAATYHEPVMTIYINGSSNVQTTFEGYPCNSEHPLTIGGRYSPPPDPNQTTGQVGPDAFFSGTIDVVRIYSRALDVDEINQMMNTGSIERPRPPSGLRVQ